jgi:hypothetical protein
MSAQINQIEHEVLCSCAMHFDRSKGSNTGTSNPNTKNTNTKYFGNELDDPVFLESTSRSTNMRLLLLLKKYGDV